MLLCIVFPVWSHMFCFTDYEKIKIIVVCCVFVKVCIEQLRVLPQLILARDLIFWDSDARTEVYPKSMHFSQCSIFCFIITGSTPYRHRPPDILEGSGLENNTSNSVLWSECIYPKWYQFLFMSFLMSGLVMVAVIVSSRHCNINPDNVATPIAASLGDLTTLALLSWIASLLFEAIRMSI
jgi:hypothetical protein